MRLPFAAALTGLALMLSPVAVSAVPQQAPAVIGGSPTTIDLAPWQVLLVMRGSMQCSGALVTPSMIVTAAHCLSGYAPGEIRAWAGISKVSERTAAQEIPVASIAMHPSFDRRTFANDVGVVTLARNADLTGRLRTIALPFAVDASVWPSSGTPALITGWGVTSTTSAATSDQLMRADIAVLAGPGQPCGEYGPDLDPVQDICAGTPEGSIDACQGDSGGPLVVNASVPVLAGVVSSGNECAKVGYPGLYSRVTSFLPWIQQQGSVPATVPESATALEAQNANGSVVVTWSVPTAPGASSTVWKVIASPSGQSCTTVSSSCEFTELPAGQAATFTVQGSNAFGDGTATTLVSPVVPASGSSAKGRAVAFRTLAAWAGWPAHAGLKVSTRTPRICRAVAPSVRMRTAGTCLVVLKRGQTQRTVAVLVD